MATERPQNLQEVFLNHVRKGKVPLTVFLVNGVRLQGILTWFDSFSLLLKRDAHSQLVYKHSISTIMPADPVRLFEEEDKAEPVARPALVQISPRETMPTDDQD
jgi:host factor-I protein